MGRTTVTKDRPSHRSLGTVRGYSDIEQRLSEVLRELVPLLVASGYGIPRLNQVLRRFYIDAAKAIGAESRTRLSNARIAALTGLTRTEVTRQSRRKAEISDSEIPFNRAQRVAYGWVSDPEFSSGHGQPKPLPFRGRTGSFSKLAKKYSGDIPARALLCEIQRLGMVRVSADHIRLVRLRSSTPRTTLVSLQAMVPWIRFLAGNSENRDLTTNAFQVTLYYSSQQQARGALQELSSRAQAFFKSVGEMGGTHKREGSQVLEVSIGVAARTPKEKIQKARRNHTGSKGTYAI